MVRFIKKTFLSTGSLKSFDDVTMDRTLFIKQTKEGSRLMVLRVRVFESSAPVAPVKDGHIGARCVREAWSSVPEVLLLYSIVSISCVLTRRAPNGVLHDRIREGSTFKGGGGWV